jgi:CheY-like chemotaxis protein
MDHPKNTAQDSILVIDDCAEMLIVDRIVLESEGYQVFTSRSGNEALEVLSQIENPALILLDYQMKDMNGGDFLLQLEKTQPDIVRKVPVVFHTGMERIPKSKAAGCIPKVSDISVFLLEVQRFIQLGQQLPSNP